MVFFEQLVLVITNAGIVLGPFVVALLNAKNIIRSRANLFLSILLISLSFSIMHILYSEMVLEYFSTEVYALIDPTFFLISPMLLFYVKELMGTQVRPSFRLFGHFLPFLLIIFLSLLFPWLPKGRFLEFLYTYQRPINIFFWSIVFLQFSIYLYFLHKRLSSYRILARKEVSNPEGVNISWIRYFMIIFLVFNIFFLFSLFVVIHYTSIEWHKTTTAFIFSLSVFALGYKGILQREIFLQSELHKETELSRSSAITHVSQDQGMIDRVLDHMHQKKPYLNAELTLTELAKELNISRSSLSQLLNGGIGDNFYDFVNKYRVEEVKQLMADNRVQHYNLLGLALEAGFKSKSTFNLIFKRFTGLTPSEYRNNLSQ